MNNAWNDAGTKPDHPCLCVTKHLFNVKSYQYWNGKFFGFHSQGINIAENSKDIKSPYQHVQWREVQS